MEYNQEPFDFSLRTPVIEQPSRKHQAETRINLHRLPSFPPRTQALIFQGETQEADMRQKCGWKGKVKQAQGCVSKLPIAWELMQGWLDLKAVKM